MYTLENIKENEFICFCMANEITGSKMNMKRNCIEVVLFGTLALFFIIPTTLCENDVTNSHVSSNDKSSTTISNIPLELAKKNDKGLDEVPNKDEKNPESAKTLIDTKDSTVTNDKKDEVKKNGTDGHDSTTFKTPVLAHELDSGAVIRAFYVFVGLSLLVVAYLIFRSFRLRSSPAQMVRKYGVLAHKQDIEMRPLPLDDDDDDDTTVFDASKLPLHSNQIA